MKLLQVSLLCLSAVFALSACKSEDERAVELVEEMGTLFEKHKGSCEVLGNEFDAFTTSHTARFVELRRIGKLEGEERKAFEAKYGKRLEAAMRKLMDGATACMSNPKVEEALKRIQ